MDELDRLLDSALTAYTADTPPQGLNHRILARLEPTGPATLVAALRVPVLTRLRSRVLVAVPTAVLLAVIFWPKPVPQQAPPPAPVMATVQPKPAMIAPPAPHRLVRRPHQPLIAPPEPPTPQQLALVRLAKEHPDIAHFDPPDPIVPITVEPLSIQPLEGN